MLTDRRKHVNNPMMTAHDRPVAPRCEEMQNFILKIHWETVFRSQYNRSTVESTYAHRISQYLRAKAFLCIHRHHSQKDTDHHPFEVEHQHQEKFVSEYNVVVTRLESIWALLFCHLLHHNLNETDAE